MDPQDAAVRNGDKVTTTEAAWAGAHEHLPRKENTQCRLATLILRRSICRANPVIRSAHPHLPHKDRSACRRLTLGVLSLHAGHRLQRQDMEVCFEDQAPAGEAVRSLGHSAHAVPRLCCVAPIGFQDSGQLHLQA